jgi:hypothetical protein
MFSIRDQWVVIPRSMSTSLVLSKERKTEDMSATEIAERYELDHDVVADAMIAPDRYERVLCSVGRLILPLSW